MTKPKRQRPEQPDLGRIAEKVLREKRFISTMGSRTPARTKDLRETFEQMLQSQLPGDTYVYIVRPEVRKYEGRDFLVYHIDKYCQRG